MATTPMISQVLVAIPAMVPAAAGAAAAAVAAVAVVPPFCGFEVEVVPPLFIPKNPSTLDARLPVEERSPVAVVGLFVETPP